MVISRLPHRRGEDTLQYDNHRPIPTVDANRDFDIAAAESKFREQSVESEDWSSGVADTGS